MVRIGILPSARGRRVEIGLYEFVQLWRVEINEFVCADIIIDKERSVQMGLYEFVHVCADIIIGKGVKRRDMYMSCVCSGVGLVLLRLAAWPGCCYQYNRWLIV